MYYIIGKGWKAQAYKPYYHGASRAYSGFFNPLGFKVKPCIRADELRRSGNLKHIVKPDFYKPVKHIIDIFQIIELTV